MAHNIEAFVFDAYGTLFDVNGVAALSEALLPGHGAALSKLWRAKQLEYSWLASLMSGPHYARPDFRALTAQALDYALAALLLPLEDNNRDELLDAYLTLPPFADARATLAQIAPRPRLILSNGTLEMLQPLVANSGLADVIDEVLSVEAAGVFKPSPRVYELAVARLRLGPGRIAFVSANGWDAAGAKAFGFTTFWINRDGLPIERHAPTPDYIIGSLTEVPLLADAAA